MTNEKPHGNDVSIELIASIAIFEDATIELGKRLWLIKAHETEGVFEEILVKHGITKEFAEFCMEAAKEAANG
ncbi:MAG: hypothetical protein LBK62_02885 [Treponema sp.]|nr:hypothetical protein [Treponema sp.]